MTSKLKSIYGIYGAGGSGLSISFFIKNNPNYKKIMKNIYFIDDDESVIKKKSINGFPIINYKQFKLIKNLDKRILISTNDIKIKRKLFFMIKSDKLKFWNYYDDSSKLNSKHFKDNSSYFAPFTLISDSVEIGLCFSCNVYSYVEHESKIGNFVSFAPGVKCNGNVIIKDNVYIGTGVIINNGTSSKKLIIGENSFISAGTFVNKNVPKNSILIGSQRIKNVT